MGKKFIRSLCSFNFIKLRAANSAIMHLNLNLAKAKIRHFNFSHFKRFI